MSKDDKTTNPQPQQQPTSNPRPQPHTPNSDPIVKREGTTPTTPTIIPVGK